MPNLETRWKVACENKLVPENHTVRKHEYAIDWNTIYDKVSHLYSSFGRPSIDPVVLTTIRRGSPSLQ